MTSLPSELECAPTPLPNDLPGPPAAVCAAGQDAIETKNYDVGLTRDLLLHVDNLFHTRVNFLLAVEALMFAGVGQVWSMVPVRLAVAYFGVWITVLFFLLNWNLGLKLQWLMTTFEIIEPTKVYKGYRSVRFLPWFQTVYLFTYVLPLTALSGWLLVIWWTWRGHLLLRG